MKDFNLNLTSVEADKLRKFLDEAGEQLRVLAEYKKGEDGKKEATNLADAADHWLEIVEGEL